ncbi:MAG: hypothetical protein OSB69_22075 [Alphaproteobacteria bacterium]|nr:hypothetical protein [Alphaproteobacteria bacterium]
MNHLHEIRPLYFLVEETNRELASRVLLATVAAASGITSYIVPQWLAWEYLVHLPHGVILFKGNNNAQSAHMVAARAAGHRVAAIEEEILGVTEPSQILQHFHPKHIDACELFLLQSEHVRDHLIAQFPTLGERMTVTGNPRTDLLREPLSSEIQDRAAKLREERGDFILVNTNFASINPRVEDAVSDYETCVRVGVIDPGNANDRVQFLNRCRWERQNMALLAQVIAASKANTTIPKIIIRPHPSENLERWREAYPDDNDVLVIREGEHTAWTAAAKLLLHTGCTTGVEAVLLGTPALSLQGGASDWHRTHTSNFVNHTARSVEEALGYIEVVLRAEDGGHGIAPEMQVELERQLLPSGAETAAERIVAALVRLAADGADNGGRTALPEWFYNQKLLASNHKIDTSAFEPKAIRALAERIAAALGHSAIPDINAIGEGMIQFTPARHPNCPQF